MDEDTLVMRHNTGHLYVFMAKQFVMKHCNREIIVMGEKEMGHLEAERTH